MERKKAHLNKKYNKARPKTPLLNKRQISFKVSKSKGKNSNQHQRKSPKTIDYEQLMEKYGNMIDNSFDKSKRTNNNKPINKNNKLDNKTPKTISPEVDYFSKSHLNKTEILDEQSAKDEEDKNYHSNNNIKNKKNQGISKLIKNQKQISSFKNGNNFRNKKNSFLFIGKNKNNNIAINRYNSNNNFINRNKNDITEFEKLKKQINNLQQENQKLKSNTITHNTYINNESYINDKLLLLLNLCRKYAKKFNKLLPLCEINYSTNEIINNSEIFQEFKNTIIQYNNMIFSEKITNLFKIKNNTDTINDYGNTLNPLDISEFEPKSMTLNITEKYKSLIKELKEENKELKNKLKTYETKINIYNNEEYNTIQQKLKNILNENSNLNNKIKELKEVENKYIYQNNIIENLKCQIDALNNTIKYKENIINYLQSVIEKAKLNPSLYNSDSISNSIIKNNNITNNINNMITPAKINNKFLVNNDINFLNYKENENGNRYENNNIISKITISTYDPKLNSNYHNSINSSNKNSSEDFNNNYIEQNSKTIIDKLKENLKNGDNNINESVNIMTPGKDEEKIKNKNNEENFKINYESDINKKEQNALNDEIEQLDQEILNLKSKLTQIIKK